MRALTDIAAAEPGAGYGDRQLDDYEADRARIGQRLGEMHAVLARETDDPAFAPETAGAGTPRLGDASRGADCHGVRCARPQKRDCRARSGPRAASVC